ncbi:outer membrane immunogenic protein [Rhizobiales bacterium GAS113]|nr:outer membrane immunogenic protein [Rhizobiales bacterium GAS113]
MTRLEGCVTRLGIVRGNIFTGRRLRQSLVVAAGALSLFAGSATAADLPTRKGPPIAPVYVPPPFTWTGFYVGVNAGGAWANGNRNNNGLFPFVGAVPVGTFVPAVASRSGGNNSGFIGGVQAGYNYQFSPGQGFVLGVETDIDWADIGRNKNNSVPFGAFTLPAVFPGTVFTASGLGAATRSNNNQYLGTVRLRAGYAWDRFLLFATGGLAYGGVNNNGNGFGAGLIATTAPGSIIPGTATMATVPTNTFIGGATTRSSSTKAGWTLGLGGEYAFTNNWTVKAEYLYANFGSNRNAPGIVLPGVASAFNNRSRSVDVNIVRVGVNYKFW